jgi:hypothetical protein
MDIIIYYNIVFDPKSDKKKIVDGRKKLKSHIIFRFRYIHD